MIRKLLGALEILFGLLTLVSSCYFIFSFSFVLSSNNPVRIVSELGTKLIPAVTILSGAIFQVFFKSDWFKLVVFVPAILMIVSIIPFAVEGPIYGVQRSSTVYQVYVAPGFFALLTMIMSLLLPAGKRVRDARTVPAPPTFD